MRYMRNLFFCILLAISTSNTIVVFAEEIQNVTVFVDEQLLEFDVQPTIIDGRTLVPMRLIFESLNCEVEWDEPNQKVVATTEDGDIITLFINNNDLYKNYEVIGQMDVPAQIMESRTFVPLRAVSEVLDCEVLWVAETYEVFITSNNYNPNQSDFNTGFIDDGVPFYRLRIKQSEDIIMEFIAEVENEIFLTDEQTELIKNVMRNYIVGFREQYEEQVKLEYKEKPENFERFSLTGDFILTQDDRGYLSYIFKGYTNWKGNSVPVTTSATINTMTNTIVSIDDIVSDMSETDWNDFYINSFNAVVQQEISQFYNGVFDIIKNSLSEVGFYLTPEGVVFYITEGVLASYDKGAVSFVVEFNY